MSKRTFGPERPPSMQSNTPSTAGPPKMSDDQKKRLTTLLLITASSICRVSNEEELGTKLHSFAESTFPDRQAMDALKQQSLHLFDEDVQLDDAAREVREMLVAEGLAVEQEREGRSWKPSVLAMLRRASGVLRGLDEKQAEADELDGLIREVEGAEEHAGLGEVVVQDAEALSPGERERMRKEGMRILRGSRDGGNGR